MLNRDLNTKTCACGLRGESQLVEQGNPPVLRPRSPRSPKSEGMTLAGIAQVLP